MATIAQIKSDNQTVIRGKTLPNTITTDMDADLRDGVADELLARGVLVTPNLAGLSAIPATNTRKVLVENVGLFIYSAALPTSGIYYNEVGGGYWKYAGGTISDEVIKEVLVKNADFTYALDPGYTIFSIDILSTVDATISAGTTPGGDDVMYPTDFVAGVWNGTTRKVYTYGIVQNVYFTGFAGQAKILIYKLKQD